jgi:hypothetical protein
MAFLLIAVKIIIWEIKIYLTLRISFEIIRALIDIIVYIHFFFLITFFKLGHKVCFIFSLIS